VVAGVAEGCRLAGCALLGGETAEHPGVLALDGFDLAGFCVGLVREEEILRPGAVLPGDALMGLRSSGLHSNGFSLVRRAFLGAAGDEAEMAAILDDVRPGLGRALGRELLEPTRIYVRSLLSLARAGLARSAAHITGGAWHENLPRALPAGLGAQVDAGSWDPDPIFQVVADAAGLPLRELFGVLNMGIGMVAVVPAGCEDDALAVANEADQDAVMLGRVVEGEGIRIR
jgi:phosphoribosylformylglycinamidine cyclo-ligase